MTIDEITGMLTGFFMMVSILTVAQPLLQAAVASK